MATNTSNTSRLSLGYLDFDTVKANLRDFLRNQSQFRDYDFTGSAFSILLDVLAYNTYYNAFYLNMVGNEMFIDSANLRSSVVSIAKQLGYTPRSITSATALVSITITPNDSATVAVIEKNSSFIANVDGQTYNFITDNAYGATLNSTGQFVFPTVTLVEGNSYTYRIVVDSTIPNQKFILPNANIDTSTLTVQVQQSQTNTNTDIYLLCTNFLQITNTTKAYFLQEDENQQFEVVFGDGVLGNALLDGNVVVISYILSDGTLANGATTFTPSTPLCGYPAA
jgi:hypothetical protein